MWLLFFKYHKQFRDTYILSRLQNDIFPDFKVSRKILVKSIDHKCLRFFNDQRLKRIFVLLPMTLPKQGLNYRYRYAQVWHRNNCLHFQKLFLLICTQCQKLFIFVIPNNQGSINFFFNFEIMGKYVMKNRPNLV